MQHLPPGFAIFRQRGIRQIAIAVGVFDTNNHASLIPVRRVLRGGAVWVAPVNIVDTPIAAEFGNSNYGRYYTKRKFALHGVKTMRTPRNFFTPEKQIQLIGLVRDGGQVREAAKLVGAHIQSIYALRRKDPAFKDALTEARAQGKTAPAAPLRQNTRAAMAAVLGRDAVPTAPPAPQVAATTPQVTGRRPVGHVIGNDLFLDIGELMQQFAPIMAHLVTRAEAAKPAAVPPSPRGAVGGYSAKASLFLSLANFKFGTAEDRAVSNKERRRIQRPPFPLRSKGEPGAPGATR